MKSINPLLAGQVMPAPRTSPASEEVASDTPATKKPSGRQMMDVSVSRFPDQEPPCGDGHNQPRRRKTIKKNAGDGEIALRQHGYRAINFGDWRNYVQIGCTLYLRHPALDTSGHWTIALQPWSTSQMRRDLLDAGLSRDAELIPRYLGMGNYPSHTHYQECVGGKYNMYCPLMHKPKAGEWPTIEKMLRHIFGAQYEQALDYLEILYRHPTQNLPIILLVSKERQTGKTTFLNFLKEVFGGNATFVTNEALRSNFNAERAGKLLILCDEAMQSKKDDSERLKALSTAKTTHIEFKGKDRYEIDNFAKIVLCSNNIVDPVYIDPEEVRYWVREVPHIAQDDPQMLEAMKREIPAFLFSLLSRPLSVPVALTRMWFRPEDLATPALARIKRLCRPTVELDLAEFLLDAMDHFGVDQLEYTNSDLQALLKAHGRDIRDAHRIVCKVWGVSRAANKLAYDLYGDWMDKTSRRTYGRYYTFTRTFLEGLVPGSDACTTTSNTNKID